MLLRRPHEVAGLFRDGRKRAGWSQEDLAKRIGASRQWISQVENGKISIEFDLVLASLQALGYGLFVESRDRETWPEDRSLTPRDASSRTPLTRNGESLGVATRGRTPQKRKQDNS